MPGSPFQSEKSVQPHIIEYQKKIYGLDEPAPVQFLIYLKQVFLKFDLGPSMKEGRQVSDIIWQSFGVSFRLGLMAIIFALLVGVPFGAYSAYRKNHFADYASMSFAMIGICIPSFVVGPVLMIIFGLWLGWLPVSGWEKISDAVLPAITLGLITAAYLARLTRSGMLDVLNQDFIRTAQAKGLSERRIIFRHALQGGVMPAVAYIGPAFAETISGSFVVETIFHIPGMGQHFINAAINRDYNLIQGLVLFYGIMIVVANLLADLLTGWLDPRARIGTVVRD